MITTAPIRHFETIDSTNLEARRLVEEAEFGPIWLRADQQIAGKGRLGRTWTSPPGNLYSTLVLPIAAPIRFVPQLGFVAALAVHDVASEAAGRAHVGLKWPNDCLIDGAKVAGILCELVSDKPAVAALGCGINVGHAPPAMAYPTACLSQFREGLTVDRVFAAYRQAIAKWLAVWDSGAGAPKIIQAWEQRAIGIGEEVAVSDSSKSLTGIFSGLAEDGALRLKTVGGGEQLVYAGDISIPSLDRMRQLRP